MMFTVCVWACVHAALVSTYAPTSMLYCASWCRSEYVFHFDQPFAIHDDLDVLKKMGMAFGLELGTCSAEDLQRAKALLPKAFETFLTSELTRQHSLLLNVNILHVIYNMWQYSINVSICFVLFRFVLFHSVFTLLLTDGCN